jgi:hypothetical protein
MLHFVPYSVASVSTAGELTGEYDVAEGERQ